MYARIYIPTYMYLRLCADSFELGITKSLLIPSFVEKLQNKRLPKTAQQN